MAPLVLPMHMLQTHKCRFCVQALTEDELMQVLMQPRNALGRQFVYQFELSGTRLHVTDDAQRAIASMVRAISAFSRVGCWVVAAP